MKPANCFFFLIQCELTILKPKQSNMILPLQKNNNENCNVKGLSQLVKSPEVSPRNYNVRSAFSHLDRFTPGLPR